MQLLSRKNGAARQAQGGFTMVEIALSLAVVAFALVAILGVLPTGMTVQKDNREDTLINQEGRYWLEAIRSGALGLEDLTNHVESIRRTNYIGTSTGSRADFKVDQTIVINNDRPTDLQPSDIIALLSTPKYVGRPDGKTNVHFVAARVKAITGPAAEKGLLTNEFSFRYELQAEITSIPPIPNAFAATNVAMGRYNQLMTNSLHDVRLIFRWPVVQRGNGWFVGNGRKTFRARISGQYRDYALTNKALEDWSYARVLVPNTFHVASNP